MKRVSFPGILSPIYDPRQIWKTIVANSDRNGKVVVSQVKLAKALDINRQVLSGFVSDFKNMGLIKVEPGSSSLIVLDRNFVWKDEHIDRFLELHKLHQSKYRRKLIDQLQDQLQESVSEDK